MFRISRLCKVHFLWFHLFVTLILSFIFFIWIYRFGGLVIVDKILKGNRSAVYATLAQISGSLLGFVIAALSIIIGYSTSEKFDFLRKSEHYPTLWKVLLSTIRVLSLTTICMIIGLIFDRDAFPIDTILCISVYCLLLSCFRIYSCLWIIENVVYLIIR